MRYQPLDFFSISTMYVLTVLVFLLAIEAGYRLNRKLRLRSPEVTDVSLGGTVGAAMALLAFLLAWVIGFGMNIHAERRHLMVAEANAIGTTNLRAGYLAEPYRTEARDLLRELTNLRVAAIDPERTEAAIAGSEQIHNALWTGAVKVVAEKDSPKTSLYLASLNEVIDRHAERIAVGVDVRIPPAILLGLYAVALFALFLMGVHSGDSQERNYFAPIVLVLIMSLVYVMIVDLDRAHEGLLVINQQAMIDLQQQLNNPP